MPFGVRALRSGQSRQAVGVVAGAVGLVLPGDVSTLSFDKFLNHNNLWRKNTVFLALERDVSTLSFDKSLNHNNLWRKNTGRQGVVFKYITFDLINPVYSC